MKKITASLTIAALALLAGTQVNAQTNKEKYLSSVLKQQSASEAKIIQLWTANKRGENLANELADYVAREIRLNSLSNNKRSSLLSAINNNGKKFKNPQALAKALMMEHYRRQGVELEGASFLEGVYHIRKSNMK